MINFVNLLNLASTYYIFSDARNFLLVKSDMQIGQLQQAAYSYSYKFDLSFAYPEKENH
jgi:hypothetical protein